MGSGASSGRRTSGGSESAAGTSGMSVEVLEAVLVDVERRRHVEDRLAVLDGDDAPGGEAAAVADAVDVVDDRHLGVAELEEVGVHRMHPAVGVDGASCGHQRLGEHLAAVDPVTVAVEALTPEQVDLERLEVEKGDQIVERSSRRSCRHHCGFAPHPKNTRATSRSPRSTVLSSRTASPIGTSSMRSPCSATIMPNVPSCTASIAAIPKRVASTRS